MFALPARQLLDVSQDPRGGAVSAADEHAALRLSIYLYIYICIPYKACLRYPLGSFSSSPRTHEAVPSPPQTSTRYCAIYLYIYIYMYMHMYLQYYTACLRYPLSIYIYA